MKQMKLIAAVFGLLLMGNSAVRAKDYPASMNQSAKNMAAAMDSMSQTITNGGSEVISGASDGILAKAANFGRGDDEASVVLAGVDASAAHPMSLLAASDAKSVSAQADHTCWTVCVQWDKLHVCVTWHQVCR